MLKNNLREVVLGVLKSENIKSNRYLDLGCGDGSISEKISLQVDAKESYGLDIDIEALERAPTSMSTIYFDLEELGPKKIPFESEYFDLVTAFEVIEHLAFGDYLLKEVHRLLQCNGYFLLSTPNLASLVNRIMLALGIQPTYSSPSKYYSVGTKILRKPLPTNHGHKNLYTLRSLKLLLSQYGFKPLSIIGAKMPYDALSWIPFSSFPSLAPNIVILAKRI